MKRLLATLIIACLVTGLCCLVWAQDPADKASQIEQTKLFVKWMKEQTGKLDVMLEQARREKNARKINCIVDRLGDLKDLINDSDAKYQRLRSLALQQRVDEANEVYAELMLNKRLAQQMVQLINQCFKNINAEGGFVETLEEWLGDPQDRGTGEVDPTETDPRSGVPEPVPDEFTPGPVSAEDEE